MKMVRCFRLAEVLVLLAIYANVSTSYSEKDNGFLNIDCGSHSRSYNDSTMHLTWENDDKYIQEGMIGTVPDQIDPSFDNHEALQSFRYFPEWRLKYCYQLPVPANISLLIRAMFYRGNSSELQFPTWFYVYINGTAWGSIEYDYDTSDYDSDYAEKPLVLEGIFFSPGNVVNLCLVPPQGYVYIPFISSLELRPLDPEGVMYYFANSRKFLLSNLLRWNCGAPPNASTVRYPDDAYDRLWVTPPELQHLNIINGSLAKNVTESSKVNSVPVKVMADAWNASHVDFEVPANLSIAGSSFFYAIFYFDNIISTNNSGGVVTNLILNTDTMAPITITNSSTLKSYANLIETQSVNIAIDGVVNAIEFYEQIIFDTSFTVEDDVEYIDFLKDTFNMSDYLGDPCVPYPYTYDWIDCSAGEQGSYSVVSLSLDNLNDSHRFLDFRSAANLTSYKGPRLSAYLIITNSQVDDITFQYLVDNLAQGVANLEMGNNSITGLPSSTEWKVPSGGLDLSQNCLRGEVPTFLEYEINNLQEFYLNLSWNLMTSFPQNWGNSTAGLQNMVALDFSYNNISDDMSSLNALVQKNSLTLQEIHVSNNNLTGVFPGELYFSNVSNLLILDLDQNCISGVLNMTGWYEKLKIAAANTSENTSIETYLDAASLLLPLYSFVNNSISDVVPTADELQPTVDYLLSKSLLSFGSGILLGGNPYCLHAKSNTQKYLCRSYAYDITYLTDRTKKSYVLIGITMGATLGGLFLLALFCFIFRSIWNLRKRVHSLQEIQQELASRKVQPPFYSYSDIKSSTRNFHKDNELGRGTFGAVYKGTLEDGNVVAVKRLFNSQNGQVLNEFLNEVVLINGIKHKNLIQLTGCCIKETERILVYEYAENGNVADALWGKGSREFLSWKQRLKICVGISRGLAYLHEELQPRIIHRDIKSANILLDKGWNPKIADFGLARPMLDEQTQAQFTMLAGTRGYSAPEYLQEGHLTEKADVFSFGVLVLEILSGRKCIDYSQSPERLYLKTWAEWLRQEGRLLELLQPELRQDCPEDEAMKVLNIALSCVQSDPKRRATMSQLVTMLSSNMEITEIADKTILREIYLEKFLGDDKWLNKTLTEENLEREDFPLILGGSGEQTSVLDSLRSDMGSSSSNNPSLSSDFGRKSSKRRG